MPRQHARLSHAVGELEQTDAIVQRGSAESAGLTDDREGGGKGQEGPWDLALAAGAVRVPDSGIAINVGDKLALAIVKWD